MHGLLLCAHCWVWFRASYGAGLLWKAHVDTQLRKKMRAYDWDTTTLAPAQAPAPSKPGNSWRCYAPQAGMGIMQKPPSLQRA